MCTLSWSTEGAQRTILFNRDEQLSRSPAFAPQCLDLEGMSALLPLDPDGGGTWIGVNQKGLLIALLNFYPPSEVFEPAERSRGLLVRDCLSEYADADAVIRFLESQDLGVYGGFILFCWGREGPPELRRWDGYNLCPIELKHPMITTSSVRAEECMRYRLDQFDNSKSHWLFHGHYNREDPALGPCMVRGDARTQSITEFRVFEESASCRYFEIDSQPPQIGQPLETMIDLESQ